MTRRRLIIIATGLVLGAIGALALRPADAAGRLADAITRQAEIHAVAVEAGLIGINHDAATGRWTARRNGSPCHHDGTAWRCTSAPGPRRDGAAQAARWGMRDLQHLGGGRMIAACRRATSRGALVWRTCFFDGAGWRAGRI